jgi:acyl carrier protein
VNIRGFRVELDEIESTLKQHPTVKNAAVIVQDFKERESENPKLVLSESEGSDLRLVAYVVSTEEDSQSLRDLLYAYISSQLPDYMIPAHFVIVSSLPFSPNGKIDYRALPPVHFSAGSAAPTPRSDIELKLQAIFAEVLGLVEIGIDDNFFRVGGHSLLAAQAAARVRESMGINLELRWFFEVPTVAGLAKEIEARIKADKKPGSTNEAKREEIEI